MSAHSVAGLDTWEPEDKSFSKHIFKQGTGDLTPNDGAICIVNITLLGEYEIDEEHLGNYCFDKECEVTIGEGDSLLSELFDKVVTSMKEGETCYVKSKVDATGKHVGAFELNSKSAVKFNMQLVLFSRAANIAELEADEKLERAQNHKNKGTELFRINRIPFAVKRYTRALQCLEDFGGGDSNSSDVRKHWRDLMCHCHLNLAACHIKTHNHKAVIEHCTEALKIDAKNVKGLFRRGQAYLKLHHYSEARTDLNTALEVEPNNKAVLNELRNINILLKKEKELYQKMFPGQKVSTD